MEFIMETQADGRVFLQGVVAREMEDWAHMPDGLCEGGVFRGCCSLTGITLPENLSRIEPYTFYGCKNLKTLRIPEHVRSIGRDAFGRCDSLTLLVPPLSCGEACARAEEIPFRLYEVAAENG